MPNFIDRRLNPKDRSLGNRQRFLKRVHDELKRAISDQVKSDKIADVDAAHGVPVPKRGADEPSFRPSTASGERQYVLPGNESFSAGDRIGKVMVVDASPFFPSLISPGCRTSRTLSIIAC